MEAPSYEEPSDAGGKVEDNPGHQLHEDYGSENVLAADEV